MHLGFRFSSLLGKAIGLSVVLSIIAGITLSIIAFLETFELESRSFESASIAELKRISRAAALVGERSDAADAYQRLIEQSVENRPITTLTLTRDGKLLATFGRPMPESSRPILDLLTPRVVPFSYRETLSDQQGEYTVNATFDAHEAFANFATNQWRNAQKGFFSRHYSGSDRFPSFFLFVC